MVTSFHLRVVINSKRCHTGTPPPQPTPRFSCLAYPPYTAAMVPQAAPLAFRPRHVALLLVVLVIALLAATASSSSASLPLGFVPSTQQLQQTSSSSSTSCCGGRHPASPAHQHFHASRAAITTKRHALPPFDSPLDPATLESMAATAAASSAAASAGGAIHEVTPEQLWVSFRVYMRALGGTTNCPLKVFMSTPLLPPLSQVGFIAGVFPFIWAGYEFWKRIDTQQRCGVCQGSGLVYESATGKSLTTARKCYACGGFLPVRKEGEREGGRRIFCKTPQVT